MVHHISPAIVVLPVVLVLFLTVLCCLSTHRRKKRESINLQLTESHTRSQSSLNPFHAHRDGVNCRGCHQPPEAQRRTLPDRRSPSSSNPNSNLVALALPLANAQPTNDGMEQELQVRSNTGQVLRDRPPTPYYPRPATAFPQLEWPARRSTNSPEPSPPLVRARTAEVPRPQQPERAQGRSNASLQRTIPLWEPIPGAIHSTGAVSREAQAEIDALGLVIRRPDEVVVAAGGIGISRHQQYQGTQHQVDRTEPEVEGQVAVRDWRAALAESERRRRMGRSGGGHVNVSTIGARSEREDGREDEIGVSHGDREEPPPSYEDAIRVGTPIPVS